MSDRRAASPPAVDRPADSARRDSAPAHDPDGRAPAPPRAHRHRRWPFVLAAVIVLVVAAVVVRLVSLTPPNVVARVTFTGTVRLPGRAPRPAWPTAGQAALAVGGVGSLGSAGGDTPRPIASVAKVMTAYLTLKAHPLGPTGSGFVLTVTPAQARSEAQDVGHDESVVPVAAGERLTERQLLEALLIPSGNNIARMLATYQAGSVAAFVTEMNQEARALGMDRTTYTDPSGFTPTTISTAADQLRVFDRAVGSPTFRQIVSMPSATLPVAGTVRNYDPLIAEGYAGKTGSDSEAEGCLAFFKHVTVAGRRLTLTGVVLGQGEGSATSVILGAAGAAAQQLVASVTPAIRARTALAAGTPVIVATSADRHHVAGVTARPLTVIGWGGSQEQVTVTTVSRLGSSLGAAAHLGTARLTGELPTPTRAETRTPVRAGAKLPAPGLGWRLAHLL